MSDIYLTASVILLFLLIFTFFFFGFSLSLSSSTTLTMVCLPLRDLIVIFFFLFFFFFIYKKRYINDFNPQSQIGQSSKGLEECCPFVLKTKGGIKWAFQRKKEILSFINDPPLPPTPLVPGFEKSSCRIVKKGEVGSDGGEYYWVIKRRIQCCCDKIRSAKEVRSIPLCTSRIPSHPIPKDTCSSRPLHRFNPPARVPVTD